LTIYIVSTTEKEKMYFYTTKLLFLKQINMRFFRLLAGLIIFLFIAGSPLQAQERFEVKDHYTKTEYRIPMRDGVQLYTVVYSPKDTTANYPILLWRTPYSCAPYGNDRYRRLPLELAKAKYIFVYQDVRGKFMSEGKFVNMRPYIPNKTKPSQVDESSDAYDAIDWLVKHVQHSNGKVGMFGISYPGFYAAMACIDAHPALKAVSPQAPIANWFVDDDMHHHGALSLQMAFNFFSVFGVVRDSLTTRWPHRPARPSVDAYSFFQTLEPLSNVNKNYFHHQIPFWNQVVKHPDYDHFWQSRNTLPYFKDIKPAVMVVGGWYDSEDLYGTLHTYASIEKNNPGIHNTLVMGPWPHGWWARSAGDKLGDIYFGSSTSKEYRQNIELPFFEFYLKDKPQKAPAEAIMFDTGLKKWHNFDEWPPREVREKSLFLAENHQLLEQQPSKQKLTHDEYLADPRRPVPYTAHLIDSKQMYYRPYMNEDQRFASQRPDVLVYETQTLQKDLCLAGPVLASLFVSTSGTDADWVVKLIDVYPDTAANPKPNPQHLVMGNYQQLVRGDILRGKYRNSLENPVPFVPGKITKIELKLQDIFHTFKKGHKMMIQIQSSWFPFFDSNPQTFTNIYKAKPSDFVKATQKVYFSKEFPSKITMNILP
jgi:putative CocE/NonD family hydrolase